MQASLFEQEVQRRDAIRPLRPRQLACIKAAFEAIREGHKRIVIQGPPGFGKTRVAGEISSMCLRKGKRPLFTFPALSLLQQTLESFESDGMTDIGVIQANHSRTNPNAGVQVASVQTLVNRSAQEFGLIMPDECHEQNDAFNAMLDGVYANIPAIGFSATPWVRGMGLRWTKLIIAATYQDMMEDGLFHMPTIYGPEHDVERGDLAVKNGEFEESGAAARMTEPAIVGDVLKEWKEKASAGKTFAFCVNRDHARAQMEAFADDGIPWGYIDANTPPGERDSERGTRKHIFAQLQHGEIAGIASVGCLIRGVDEKILSLLDLQPTRGEVRHVQKWGRLRTPDPNTRYVGIDHAGNNNNIGLYTDIYHDTLDCRKPGDRAEAYEEDFKAAKPRKCPKCRTLIPAGSRNCPTCQERMPLYPGVTVKDGRMVEIKPKPKASKEQISWFRELMYVGRESKFKPDWAAHQFRAKYGVFPGHFQQMAKVGKKPSDEVKQFVRESRKEFLQRKKEAQTAARVEAIEMSL